MNSPTTSSTTSFLALEAGVWPSPSPGGQQTAPLSPAPAPANLSPAPGSAKAPTMPGTFGPLFETSSPSSCLQQRLESRLRATMDVNGSPEFDLTWKHWDMQSGPQICALRALRRPTSGNGCSGWPTARSNDATGTQMPNQDGGNRLPETAQLAAWPTPRATESTESTETQDARSARGTKASKNLDSVAQLAGWATPRAEDAESAGMRHSRGVADTLSAQAGQDAASSPAVTGNPAACRLNPRFSLWLMGYLAAWASCAERAMLSCRKSPRRSSKPT